VSLLIFAFLLDSAGLFQSLAMAVDWALYEKDVIQLYVNECKTIYETLKYLREKHSIDIRQVDHVHRSEGHLEDFGD
jgi:hypothetical protein